jgi:glyoxylase-like metal-dependent hydrolase (beta-lactamase superfamily II)
MNAAEDLQLVAPGLFVWQMYDETVKAELTSCAVSVGGALVLIDPIPLSPDAMDGLLGHGQPAVIVLTNGNHARAAEQYRDRFRIAVAASREAEEELGFAPDEYLADGDSLAGVLTVHALPGAGPGEIALHHDAGRLHVGDALINFEPNGFSRLPDKYCTAPAKLRESLRKLLPLEFSLLTFAHGLPLVTRAHERLAQLVA